MSTAATRTPSIAAVIAGARFAARMGGCTCDVEVRLQQPRPGVFLADVAHEPNCRHPAMQRGRDA